MRTMRGHFRRKPCQSLLQSRLPLRGEPRSTKRFHGGGFRTREGFASRRLAGGSRSCRPAPGCLDGPGDPLRQEAHPGRAKRHRSRRTRLQACARSGRKLAGPKPVIAPGWIVQRETQRCHLVGCSTSWTPTLNRLISSRIDCGTLALTRSCFPNSPVTLK